MSIYKTPGTHKRRTVMKKHLSRLLAALLAMALLTAPACALTVPQIGRAHV